MRNKETSLACGVEGCEVATTGICKLYHEVEVAFADPNNEYTGFGIALIKEEAAKEMEAGCAKCIDSVAALDKLTPVKIVETKSKFDNNVKVV